MGRPLAGLPGGNARLGAFLPALPSSGTTQDRILRHRDSLSAADTDPLLRSHRPPGGDRPHIGRRTAGCRRRQKLSRSELNRSLHSARRHQSRNFGPSEQLVRNHHRRRQKGLDGVLDVRNHLKLDPPLRIQKFPRTCPDCFKT